MSIGFEILSLQEKDNSFNLETIIRAKFFGIDKKKAKIHSPLLGTHLVDPKLFQQLSPGTVDITVTMIKVSGMTPVGELLYKCKMTVVKPVSKSFREKSILWLTTLFK